MMMNSKELSHSPAARDGFSLISDEKLLALYSTMLKCRTVEDRASILLKMNHLNGNSAAGREAIIAGVGIDLLPEDTARAFPSERIFIFIKGLPLERLFAQQFRAIAPALSIAEELKLATDAAIACKANRNNGIVVFYCSSETMYDGSCEETLKFAGVQRLPMLFVSMSTGADGTEHADLQKKAKAKAYGFPVIVVEGNDAVAVYRVAYEAIAHARKGDGPTLIDCRIWQAGDPLLNMEKYLIRKGLFSDEFKRQVEAGFLEELDAAMEMGEKASLRG